MRPKLNHLKTSTQIGFTIIELLVTISLVAISLPAIAIMVSSIGGVNDRARDLSAVHALVERKVETLRSIGFSGLTDGTVDFASELPQYIAEPRTASYTVSSLNDGVKQVDVAISYSDYGNIKNLSYTTYIGELGVGQY